MRISIPRVPHPRWLGLALLGGVGLLGWAASAPSEDVTAAGGLPAQEVLTKTFNEGNYKDAYEGFRKRLLWQKAEPARLGQDLNMAVQCLRKLGREAEVDALVELAVKTHSEKWQLLHAAARTYLTVSHHGYIVAGKYQRGNRRGGGRLFNSWERDRVRALQLLNRAEAKLPQDRKAADMATVFETYAQALSLNRLSGQAWRLTDKTDLSELPDYTPGWYRGFSSRGAPATTDGQPIFYPLPETFDQAVNDGQRWRWALTQVAEYNPRKTNSMRMQWGSFLLSQFGVQTMARSPYAGRLIGPTSEKDDQSGPYAVHTLQENETLAKLATGVARFELPDEYNFIKVFREVAENPQTGQGAQALLKLASIYQNRRQLPKAAEVLKQLIRQYGNGPRGQYKQQLEQITGNWGQFEPIGSQPPQGRTGDGAVFDFRFRNGQEVSFEARPINIELLGQDVQAYLKGNPARLDWQKINIDAIGNILVQGKQEKYLGEPAAKWTVKLKPAEDHLDRRITVTTPLQKAGAFFVTARMSQGNTCSTVLWLTDTVIFKKPLEGQTFLFVADSLTGEPVSGATLELFGYRVDYIRVPGQRGNRTKITTTQTTLRTNADGQAFVPGNQSNNRMNWLISGKTNKGRYAHLGFTNLGYGSRGHSTYAQSKAFLITDRPVYRPEQSVKFKVWLAHATYDPKRVEDFAGKSLTVEIRNPKGEKVLNKTYKADKYGGAEDELQLPQDATLGRYSLSVRDPGRRRYYGGSSFRVEEYKKPEFEVTVEAPSEPVMLGQKVAAKIKANYYFGAPVVNASVKYKVMRTAYTQRWYPVGAWEWLYGKGYRWCGVDYLWYPGWARWGCPSPRPWWWGRRYEPPELVAEQEVPVGPNGEVSLEIDTALAKQLFGDSDHKYEITAEVTDQSRRTIVGTGTVMVARRPFEVTCWLNTGYSRAGEVLQAHLNGRTINGKPVQGSGELQLLSISYNQQGKPTERIVQTWEVNTDDQGNASQQFTAARAGQYRLSYTLADKEGHRIEGGYVFTVTGQDFQGNDFRFNQLELLADQTEYLPGDELELMINTNRTDNVVLLFVKPAGGTYPEPRMLRRQAKSSVERVQVDLGDMPNFFVEAVTIADGEVYRETKEFHVPPSKRIVDLVVTPNSKTYKPGEEGSVEVQVTDSNGNPFVGSLVISVYDKSVEYISGGSNVPDIRKHFWQWRRRHYPRDQHNLGRMGRNLVGQDNRAMQILGVFGYMTSRKSAAADETIATRPQSTTFSRLGGVAPPGRAMFAAPAPLAEAAGDSMAEAASGRRGLADKSAYEDGAKATQTADGEAFQEPTVRKNFADTALWAGALVTDQNGRATIPVNFPESLTTWKVKAWTLGPQATVGSAETEVITKKDLLVRLQSPRFFTQKDEIVLSANVHNYLPTEKQVQVALETQGGVLELLGEPSSTLTIPADGEARVDWRVRVVEEGEAVVRMLALTDQESDAVEMSFPAYVHGMLKTESFAGALRPEDQTGRLTVRVPQERRISQTLLEVRYSPTLAGAMIDALPYLSDYPYGCTEQTLNRFLPTVITQKVLQDMGLNLAEIRDKRTNLNAQELGDAQERSAQWKQRTNAVFDEEEVSRRSQAGIKRLVQMQNSDGGWGWFSGRGERSYPHTTAVVLHGLLKARELDVDIPQGVIERGVQWLAGRQAGEVQKLKNGAKEIKPFKIAADNLDAFVFLVLQEAGQQADADMRDFLYRDRTKLSVYAKAIYGLALHRQKEQAKLAMILRNIEQFVVQDEENQTAYLKLPVNNRWWRWYGGEIEADAWYLKLLAAVEPKGQTASRLAKYILNNRKHGTYWNSTRDTAYCIEALAEYMKASGEDQPNMTVEVWFDGQKQKEVEITSENLLSFDNTFQMVGDAVEAGEHTIELRKKGQGPLYYNAYLTNFTMEDPITHAGLEVKVRRKLYKLVKVEATEAVETQTGQATKQKVEKFQRVLLESGDTLASGDLVEVELELESKNDYEYLIFEDRKASGFEAVAVRSGYVANGLRAYMEVRDEKVAFFVRQLLRGKHSISYRLRAEIPGSVAALPAVGYAMYAPELKGNSDEIKLNVVDRQGAAE